jgi:hydroxymethylglutaryl-CoA lyase
MTANIRIYEVGPRDGLQNEKAFIPTESKIELIKALLNANLDQVEITSFVNPRWIPPLADAEAVVQALIHHPQIDRLTALVPNMKGLERAENLKEIAVFMSASATHNQRNINKTHDEAFEAFQPVFEQCQSKNIRVRAYVSTVWGCPYEGKIDPRVSTQITKKLLDMGAYEVSLGDTIGVGNPKQTREILEVMLSEIPAQKLSMHMHDTWGRALANCLVGLEMGITSFDSSIGGLGGCPYAPGASGNLATEDLVAMLLEMGYPCHVQWDALIQAGALAQKLLGRKLMSRALQAELGKQNIVTIES